MGESPMSKTKLHLAERRVTTGTFRATDEMIDEVMDVLQSGRISYGPKSMWFEHEFAYLHDCKYAVLSNSGTSSLHVALQALKELHGWHDGDEVIVPASTFVATINIVLHNNLTPIFVDIEPETYGINPKLIPHAITEKTRAIIPVHLYGQPCQMVAIMEIAGIEDLAIIEDSCEAMFVTHAGAKVGSMGQIGCFSTYNAHLITTGVGGIATTNEPAYAMKMRSLVNHGLAIEELNTDENFSPRPAVGRSFRFTHAGHSYRITELEAAIGLVQLRHHSKMLRTRRRNAAHLTAVIRFLNSLSDEPIFWENHILKENTHAWMMFPIVIQHPQVDKEKLTRYLNSRQIETRDMMPIVSQPIYQEMISPEDYPIASFVDRNGFYIGCHQDIEPEDIEYVRQVFTEFLTDEEPFG
jgi:perosamine synthetase